MTGRKKEGVCLPYGNLITKIPEHVVFNYGEEEYVEDATKIGKAVLTTMRYEIIDGKVTEKPLKKEDKNG